jgi:hypothetical protein
MPGGTDVRGRWVWKLEKFRDPLASVSTRGEGTEDRILPLRECNPVGNRLIFLGNPMTNLSDRPWRGSLDSQADQGNVGRDEGVRNHWCTGWLFFVRIDVARSQVLRLQGS